MITYKPAPAFKPFTVSFEINSREEALALINACYNLSNIERVVCWDSTGPATISQMMEISDKMVSGQQWVDLTNSVFKPSK